MAGLAALALLVAGLLGAFLLAGLRQDKEMLVRERAAVLAALRARETLMLQAVATADDEEATLKDLVEGTLDHLHRRYGQRLSDGFDIEFVYITDANGAVIYASEHGRMNEERAYAWIRPGIERALADGHKALHTGVVAGAGGAGLLVARPFQGRVEGLAAAQPLVAVTVDMIDPDFLKLVADPINLKDMQFLPRPDAKNARKGVFLPNLSDGSETALVWQGAKPGSSLLKGLIPVIAVLTALLAIIFLVLMVRARRLAAELAANAERAQELAAKDQLTGLLNRTAFLAALEEAISERGADESVALLFIDLDDFKETNDAAGHAAGDDLLRAVSRRIEYAVAGSGAAARFGGDEFVVFTACRTPEDLDRLVARLGEQLAPPVLLEAAGPVAVSASIGAARLPEDAATATELMRLADLALYRAKAEGRGLYRQFSPAFEQEQIHRRQVESELEAGLEAGDVKLVYQPLVDVESERIIGFEALARWDHPTRGRLLPGEFVPIAEASRLVNRLDAYVLRRACTEAWALPDVTLSVNMSALNLRDPEIADQILATLAQTGFDPRRLEIEITESAMLAAMNEGQQALVKLRERGVRLALDDFGTGNASLVHIRRLPITKIKIDKSFIHNLGVARDAAAIVEYVVRLGRSLGITLTAEGVETREQLRFLRAFGTHQAQGYLFAPPVPLAAAVTMLTRQRETAPGPRPAATRMA